MVLYAVPVAVAVLNRALAKLLRLRSRRCQLGEEGRSANDVPAFGALGRQAYRLAISSPTTITKEIE